MRSILDFIIYFMAPAVSLLSEPGDGSGLKAITNHRRREREALHRRSTGSEGSTVFSGPQVVSVWGVGIGGPSPKTADTSVQNQPQPQSREGSASVGGPLAVPDNKEGLGNAGPGFPASEWGSGVLAAPGRRGHRPESLGWGLLTKDPGGSTQKKAFKMMIVIGLCDFISEKRS